MTLFRTLKVVNGQILYWQENILKLDEDCRSLDLFLPEVCEKEAQNYISEQGASKGIWRFKILVNDKVQFSLNPYSYAPSVKKLTVFPKNCSRMHPKVKWLECTGGKTAYCFAQESGVDDTLTLTENGHILECSFANFLWVHDNVWHYSDPALPYYEGLMQRILLRKALQMGFGIRGCRHKVEDLPENAFLFTCNALQGVIPVVKIEERCFSRNIELESQFSL